MTSSLKEPPVRPVVTRKASPDGATLPITDRDADREFRETAQTLEIDPDDRWVGDYVNYEWRRSRYILESDVCSIAGKQVLEFGCNFGATAIVMAHLGAKITGIDINPKFVTLARLNAARYGMADRIRIEHVPDTTRLPYQTASFDMVCANSVLHLVSGKQLKAVQSEINRVLKPGGILAVLGTSNRLWPREQHSGRWLVNYLPRAFDRFVPNGRSIPRGASPWQMRFGFGRYEDLFARDGGRTYLRAKAHMGLSGAAVNFLTAVNLPLGVLGLSVGMLMPFMCMVLRKREERPEP